MIQYHQLLITNNINVYLANQIVEEIEKCYAYV